VFACLARTGSAQAPSCAWGDGVTLPISGDLGLLLASDGSAGVLAFTWPWGSSPGLPGTLRMFHVLEQGRLDPDLPTSGVPILVGADLGEQFQLYALRAIPDGSGGVYLLTRTCNAWAPGLRCWEASQMRLQHLTAQGAAAPGWPTIGHVIPCHGSPYPLNTVDIVADGAGGVTVVWLDGTVWNGTYPIMAQRFAADGTTSWPGGNAGLNVLTSPFANMSMRVAGDGVGGFVVVASRLVSSTSYRMELVATRVTGSGALAWGSAGKPVLLQPNQSASIQGVSMDAGSGVTFVSATLTPVTSGPSQFFTQALTSAGNRAWGTLGLPIGPTSGESNAGQIRIPAAFATLHADASGLFHLQIQDEFGTPLLGPDQAGMPFEWTNPWFPPTPLATADGNMILIMSKGFAPDPPDVRALEFDGGGNIAPAWPDTGFQVCGGIPGHEFGSAFVGAGHLFVGLTSSGWFGTQPRVQRLSRAVLDVVDGRPAHALELAPLSPNPARGAWTASIGLREASHVVLEAFDVAGRRVLEQDFGTVPPGWHPLPVMGGSLAAGVYRVRVRAGMHSAERVLVRIR
jgi:hypothetical protein